MFDWPLDFFSLVIAVGAFILALKAFTRTDSLQARLNALESAQATAAARSTTPPMPPAAEPGFEERIGTRWVVWIGGLTLALGGFFLVRYTIDAGLLGPGVRTILGGLFALALLGAGEWTRRQESIAEIETLPIANI